MNTLKIEKNTLRLASKFDELTANQLEQIFQIKDLDLEDWQARLALFKILIGKNRKLWWWRFWNEKAIVLLDWLTLGKLIWRQKTLDADDYFDLMYFYTDFLFNNKQNLTRNPYPYFFLKGRVLKGPKDRFQDLSYGEFVRADEYFLVYQTTKDIKYLDKMIAVMWRFGIKKRQKFDFDTVESRVNAIASLHPAQKLVILMWYIGCRKIIEKEFRHIYPESDDSQKEKETSKKVGLSNITAYARALGTKPMEYAPTPSDKDVESIYHASVYYVLRKLNQDLHEYKKLKENGNG